MESYKGVVVFLIVGELINSTRRKVGRAIRDRDDSLIRRLARCQMEAGAQVIDLNAGESMEKEVEDLLWLIAVVEEELGPNVRLAIDTSDPKAMVSGLKACSGRPVLNSVSNEKTKESLLELAVQCDADIIGLAMGERGMPKTVKDRISEIRTLLRKCEQVGIDHDRLYMDLICMSVGSSPEQGRAVLDVVRRTKEELGVKTFMAVSNVSFGLPNRRLLNRTYLAMLIEAGLDGVILDPTDTGVMETICAARALTGKDNYCMGYIRYCRNRRGDG